MLTSRLGGFAGLRVADLFAGSGTLGLEALSRGAAHCLFVERDKAALLALRANIAALDASNAEVRAQSVELLGPLPEPLDLVMMDPPYGGEWRELAQGLIEAGWIGRDTVVTIEDASGSEPDISQLAKIANRKVGKAKLIIYRGWAD